MKNKIIVAAGLLLAAWGAYGTVALRAARADTAAAMLALDSLEAVKDTTRLQLVETAQGEARIWERRAVQVTALLDSTNATLDRTTASLTEARVEINNLRMDVVGQALMTEDSVPGAEFHIVQTPYDVQAQVIMTEPPAMRLAIQLDPIPMVLRVGCGVNNDLAKAYVGIQVPEWARIQILDSRQDVGVCNPHLVEPPPGFWARHGDAVAAGVATVSAIWAAKTLVDMIRGK